MSLLKIATTYAIGISMTLKTMKNIIATKATGAKMMMSMIQFTILHPIIMKGRAGSNKKLMMGGAHTRLENPW